MSYDTCVRLINFILIFQTDLVERFLQFLYQHMNKDNIWLG